MFKFKYSNFLIFIIALGFFAVLLAPVVFAGDLNFTPNVTIPGKSFKAGVDIPVTSTLLGDYIAQVYKFAVGIAGILAVLVIAFGGVLWVFSGGSSDKIGKAKEMIVGAIIGLILALGSYLILNTVNPNLVNLNLYVEPVIEQNLTLTRFNISLCSTSNLMQICGGIDKEKNCYYTHPGVNNICLLSSEKTDINKITKDDVDFYSIIGINDPFEINKGFIEEGSFQETKAFVPELKYNCGDIFLGSGLFSDRYRVGSDCGTLEQHCVLYVVKELGNLPGIGSNSLIKNVRGNIFGNFKYSDCLN